MKKTIVLIPCATPKEKKYYKDIPTKRKEDVRYLYNLDSDKVRIDELEIKIRAHGNPCCVGGSSDDFSYDAFTFAEMLHPKLLSLRALSLTLTLSFCNSGLTSLDKKRKPFTFASDFLNALVMLGHTNLRVIGFIGYLDTKNLTKDVAYPEMECHRGGKPSEKSRVIYETIEGEARLIEEPSSRIYPIISLEDKWRRHRERGKAEFEARYASSEDRTLSCVSMSSEISVSASGSESEIEAEMDQTRSFSPTSTDAFLFTSITPRRRGSAFSSSLGSLAEEDTFCSPLGGLSPGDS
jgi:hypothetical protein